ncbi:Pimeloyl-ACP methyl ester carboxylesterase [Parasphingorhabdus marina DSM 22363]|uniref:Pimeloyl-ACP methyl ester carboxylesterase n=1 Tax=Parasphingorhabdus marina DSM 22363 TaxID=1123272 RepID=A0A1N6D3I4_9SPHN|nr:alpha/beta hydrolase [Parasphingorhabdus marina]SIN65263.1 Pimeloyl-ACP methyl ester carboxylesterase [Parasphingorhabdus marina DSM 22363]
MVRPAIVLIPGNMCDATLWDAVRADLRADRWKLVDADVTSDDSIAAMARRMADEIPSPVVLIGFSMGGIIALEFARLFPDRLAGLVLLDTNPGADLPDRAAARPGQQERVRHGALASIVRDELKPSYLASVNRENGPMKDHLLSMALALGEDAFISQSEALRTRNDNWGILQDIQIPSLVGCGEEDALCPPEWHRKIAQALPNVQLHIVPDSGHMLPLEQPAVFRRILMDYLKQF